MLIITLIKHNKKFVGINLRKMKKNLKEKAQKDTLQTLFPLELLIFALFLLYIFNNLLLS